LKAGQLKKLNVMIAVMKIVTIKQPALK
jgi:hypothetical protein